MKTDILFWLPGRSLSSLKCSELIDMKILNDLSKNENGQAF